MTLEQLYYRINGDYKDIIARFSSDVLITKFVLKFAKDTSFTTMNESLEKKDYKQAFLSAHTLKGLCLNLSFTDLCHSVSQLTEELRNANEAPNPQLVSEVKNKYYNVISAIDEYTKHI